MRTEGPLWREKAQKKPIFSEGLFECRTMVRGYCYNIAHKWICKWHRLALTESVQLICLLCMSRSGHTHFSEWGSMAWMLAQDRFLHCDAHCNITGRVTLHVCYNFLDHWGTQQSETTLFGMHQISIPPQVEEGIRGGSWGGHFTSCIIQSYLLLGFFVWLRVSPATRALMSRLDSSGFNWELGFFKHISIKVSILCW